MIPLDICIISSMHPSMNPRVVKEADALTAAGYTVGLIAPDFSARWRDMDEEFTNRPWRILERPQFGPLSRRGARAAELARRLVAGLAVRHFGVGHPAAVMAAHHPIAPALVTAARRHRARLYLAHITPALPAAALAAAHHGAAYAFDAEDFHAGELPDTPANGIANRLIHSIEAKYLPGCAYITAASPGIADAYARTYNIRRPVVVLNAFPRARAPKTWTERGTASPSPSIYWFSQTIGADRGLQSAVRALALSKVKPHLYLRGNPAEGAVEELLSIAGNVSVSENVHILPIAQPYQMEALASAYDVGLCSEIGHTRNREIALANKQFTYFLAGIPALMSDIPAHRLFAPEADGAVEIFGANDPASLASAIDSTLGDAVRLAGMRRAAWQLGQAKFNAEIETERICGVVKTVIRPFRAAVRAL